MEKIVQIDGKAVKFRATAAILRIYRTKFRRDMIGDICALDKRMNKAKKSKADLTTLDLEIFENAAYVMAKHADPENVPGSPEEWLEQFNTFSIYSVLPELLELWEMNTQTLATSKKNIVQLTAR